MCGALAAGLPGAAARAETHLVREGAILGQLYLPVRSGHATQFAARELRDHLAQMTGAELETAWRAWTPNASGFVLAIRPEAEWKGKESSQAFTIEERETPAPVVAISGNTDLAVLYGVYEYLDGGSCKTPRSLRLLACLPA